MHTEKLDFQSFLKKTSKIRIAIVGDVMFDSFSYGMIHRTSPEAQVPVVDIESKKTMAGGAANVARNVASLGGKVTLFSVTGNDEAGKKLIHSLREDRIETRHIIVSEKRPTTSKDRIVVDGKHFARIDRETKAPISSAEKNQLIRDFKKSLKNIDVLIFSDYAKGVISGDLVARFTQLAHTRKIPIIVDTKPVHIDFYKNKQISVVTPNVKEALEMSGKDNFVDAGKILKKYFESVLVTQGEDGMTLFEEGRTSHVKAENITAVDVSGCGDTVVAVLALAFGMNISHPQAIGYANHAAAISVQKPGTAIVTRKEFLSKKYHA